MFENINEVAILVSAIFAVALGNIWYSPMLFGNTWAKITGGQPTGNQEDSKELFYTAVKGILVYIVVFFILSKFISTGNENGTISQFGFLCTLIIFLWAHILTPVIWEKKPFSYFLLHAGYFAIALLGGFGIISYWPW